MIAKILMCHGCGKEIAQCDADGNGILGSSNSGGPFARPCSCGHPACLKFIGGGYVKSGGHYYHDHKECIKKNKVDSRHVWNDRPVEPMLEHPEEPSLTLDDLPESPVAESNESLKQVILSIAKKEGVVVDPSDLVVREVVRQHKKEDEIDSVRRFFVNVPSTMEYVERSLFIQ